MGKSVRPASQSRWSQFKRDLYPWYVVGILMLTFSVAYIDRQILTLLIEPIKRDLGVTDTHMGLLAGFAFAIFYTVLGVPIARMSDRGNRLRIISAGVFVWSIMTALCGFAGTFWQLFLARIGVGAGEACVPPAAYSIVADSFRPEKVARAVGILLMGVYIGLGFAMIGGSAVVQMSAGLEIIRVPFIGEMRSWQLAFVIAALPGILVLALLSTIREPARRLYRADGSSSVVEVQRAAFSELLAFFLERKRLFGAITISTSLIGMVITAFFVWVPEVLRRSHEVAITDAGFAFGAILLVFGASGCASVGWIVARFARRDQTGAEIRAMVVSSIAIIPFGLATTLAPNYHVAVAMLAPTIFFMAVAQALSPSLIQLVTPNHLRAQTTAIWTLIAVLLGTTAGPALVAIISDFLFRDERMLGQSLALVTVLALPIGVVFLNYAIKPFLEHRQKVAPVA
jgi:MFS family permease